jgi:hypothetical protein
MMLLGPVELGGRLDHGRAGTAEAPARIQVLLGGLGNGLLLGSINEDRRPVLNQLNPDILLLAIYLRGSWLAQKHLQELPKETSEGSY